MRGGDTHTAPSKYHDEFISLVFIHTKYGEPIVIMVFSARHTKSALFEPPLPVPWKVESFRRCFVSFNRDSPYKIYETRLITVYTSHV
jgi:hypothetical protein